MERMLPIWFVAVLFFAGPAPGHEIGQPVFLISPAKTYDGPKVIETFSSDSIGFKLFISVADGDWLWLTSDKPGWIHRRHVISLGDAESHFSRMIEKNSRSWNGYYGRGQARVFLNRAEAAVDDLTKAIELAPASWDPYILRIRAEAWNVLNELDRSIADSTSVIEQGDKVTADLLASAFYFRGFARQLQGDLEAAGKDYDESIQRDPDDKACLTRRGLLQRDLGQLEGAIEDLDAVLKQDPHFQMAQNDRGTTHEQLGNYDLAVKDFRNVVRKSPEALFVLQSREGAIYADGRARREQIAELSPKRSAYYNLVMQLAGSPDDSVRDGEEAVRFAKKLRELDAGRSFYFVAAEAAAYAEAEDFDRAAELQREAIEIGPEDERKDLEATLAAYRDGRPYRLAGAAASSNTAGE